MAYSVTIAVDERKDIAGRMHVTWLITEQNATSTDEYSIETPSFFRVTVFESELTTAGSATKINPELGDTAGWDRKQDVGTWPAIWAAEAP